MTSQMITLGHKGGVQQGPKTDHEILEPPLTALRGIFKRIRLKKLPGSGSGVIFLIHLRSYDL